MCLHDVGKDHEESMHLISNVRLITKVYGVHLVCLLFSLHKESALEAERIGELVRSLGVEHQILRLEWEERKGGKRGGELPPKYIVMEEGRRRMLSFCQSMNITTLMIAHHLEDQIGKQCLTGRERSGQVS